MNETWQHAASIVLERPRLCWARRTLKLLGLVPVFHIGEKWQIKLGEWVHTQDLDTRYPNVWAKMMLTYPQTVEVVFVQEDGWILLKDEANRLRYKVWPTALREV